ncbi:hypothetical protein GOV12_03895 [Candidatus Pacearchaeota archaeon]|nr:hypothetical protein [Candidatus Pacearchaeota archaeon]
MTTKSPNLEGKFPESEELIRIVNSHGWSLWDTSIVQCKSSIMKWNDIEKYGPAQEFLLDHNYIFAPIQENGQSLKDAYSITKGLGPSIMIDDPSEERWRTLYIPDWYNKKQGNPIPISRLIFFPEAAAATSAETRDNLDPDVIGISYPHLIDTFQKHFRIIHPSEYGHTTLPIPSPFHPEDN